MLQNCLSRFGNWTLMMWNKKNVTTYNDVLTWSLPFSKAKRHPTPFDHGDFSHLDYPYFLQNANFKKPSSQELQRNKGFMKFELHTIQNGLIMCNPSSTNWVPNHNFLTLSSSYAWFHDAIILDHEYPIISFHLGSIDIDAWTSSSLGEWKPNLSPKGPWEEMLDMLFNLT